uniref:Uncharacterized protein n=1 Tax=Zosterops lateralis melanops TaxID=1220523 RepID=A0A8D2P631_ZOSLA
MQTSGLKESCTALEGSGQVGRQPAVTPLTSPRLYLMFLQLIDLHLQGEEGPASPPQPPETPSPLTHLQNFAFCCPRVGLPGHRW